MKVLIVGGTSLLGHYLYHTKPSDIDLSQTWYTNVNTGWPMLQLDVCNKSQVAYVFERVQPQIVIHCAAVGSVDHTERHFTETQMVNVFGMENVLRAAQDHRALFVYISTNAVFAGDKPSYSENSERQPVNRYGSIKRDAENVVMKARNWLIIRPFLLYGWPYPDGRQNWVTTILKKLQVGETVRLVNDVWWQPTSAADMAQVIWGLIGASLPEQIYNVAANERVTLYELGLRVAEVWGLDRALIQPIASSELRGIARRPIDTSYNTSKIAEMGFELNGIEEGVKQMRQDQLR